jgi:hydrogenase maturation protease
VKTTVVGIGNVLLGDDGVGVWLVHRLIADYRFEPEIELLDGGTLGLGLMAHLGETERLMVIDAAKTGGPPGTLAVLGESDLPATLRSMLSTHEASLCDLLAALTLLGRAPREFVAIGIQPQSLAPGIALSAPVRATLAHAESEVIERLGAWGIAAVRTRAAASEDEFASRFLSCSDSQESPVSGCGAANNAGDLWSGG